MAVAAPLRSTAWDSDELATFPPPKNWLPPPAGAVPGKPRNAGSVGPIAPKNPGSRRSVPYWITVGVPVTVQPGTVTELYPDNDGSPTSAPPLTSRFPLLSTGVGVVTTAAVLITPAVVRALRPTSRRTTSATAAANAWAGVAGSCGLGLAPPAT
jgi:hypothetical protein